MELSTPSSGFLLESSLLLKTVAKSASCRLSMLKQAKSEHPEGGLSAMWKPNWRWNELTHSIAKFSQTGTLICTHSLQLFSPYPRHCKRRPSCWSRVRLSQGASILENRHGCSAFFSYSLFIFYFGGSENQNFQIKSRLRSILSPYLDWLRCSA